MEALIITIVVIGLIYYCVTLLPLPEPFRTIANVVFILIAISYLLKFI